MIIIFFSGNLTSASSCGWTSELNSEKLLPMEQRILIGSNYYRMKYWIAAVLHKMTILKYALQNVTISYNKMKFDIFEMLAILE